MKELSELTAYFDPSESASCVAFLKISERLLQTKYIHRPSSITTIPIITIATMKAVEFLGGRLICTVFLTTPDRGPGNDASTVT